MKTSKVLMAMVAGFFLMSGTAFAFHGGGVAHCDGCHSMHNSADNPRAGSATAASLMKGSDSSSTCLNCHEGSGGYHVNSTDGTNVSQGGDFFWVSTDATYTYDGGHAGEVTVDPDNMGHNVIAADFTMSADATNNQAPGGSMMSNTLSCTSCHDPHGQVDGGTGAGAGAIVESGSYGADALTLGTGEILGNYRLLGDDGFKNITANAPVATAANDYASNYGYAVDYGSGMSSWCLSCHPSFNDNANMHPVNVAVPTVYNSYVATGNFTGDVTTAYDSLVPFERGVTDGSALDPASKFGVSGSEQVMCLSCHRAHASAFNNALRWDNETEFLAESAILLETTSTLMANGAVPYYKDGAAVDIVTEYGQYQRQLCNKCHVKD